MGKALYVGHASLMLSTTACEARWIQFLSVDRALVFITEFGLLNSQLGLDIAVEGCLGQWEGNIKMK